VRACLVVLALITLTVGCGSSTNPSQGGASDPGSIEALWKKSGESVALVPGTSDYSPGDVRVSFLVVNSKARVIAPSRADVWIARAMIARPFAHTIAMRERVGVPGILPGRSHPRWETGRRPPHQWHLVTEPWTFLVGGDGRIKAKFEGAVSARELESAVNRFLR
jgi:hypothetical protein